MQRHAVESDAAPAERLGEDAGEMQSRRRRRHRPFLAREYGLVVGAVLRIDATAAGDIGRQRHIAALGERLVERGAGKGEAKHHLAALTFRLDGGVELLEETYAAFA